MLKNESEIHEWITRIVNSDSLAEGYALFRVAPPMLKKCKIVFAAKNGASLGFAANKTFSAGAAIRSLFNTEKVLVLDTETVHEMERGKATFPVDYSIALDTQALSYLQPYLAGESSRIPADFREVFSFIARDDVFVDPIPYLSENLHNLADTRNRHASDQIYNRLKAYEVLRTLDSKWLQDHGEVRSTLTELELAKPAQDLISGMYANMANHAAMIGHKSRHQFMYCLLLKMVTIQIRAPQARIEKKVSEFAEFCDVELGAMCLRETVIARAYFEKGQNLKFFGKMQKKNENIFKVLDGMAWDFWHVRQLEELLTMRPSSAARYFFPALLTFDKGLIEIIDLYPLKACAFIEGENRPLPYYDGDWLKLVTGGGAAQIAFVDRFCSQAAVAARGLRRDGANARLGKIVGSLEDELGQLVSVIKP